jgi:hypothetical protein
METNTIIIILLACLVFFFIPDVIDFFTSESVKTKNYRLTVSKIKENRKFENETKELETNQPEQDKNLINYYKLFKKYHKGIDSSYNLHGDRIEGVKPDHQKAIFYLEKTINSKVGKNEHVLELGKIYHQGMFGMKPDHTKAMRVYTSILDNVGDTDIRNEATEGIRDINKIKALKWLNLPLDHNPLESNMNLRNQNIRDGPEIIVELEVAENINQPEIIELLDDQTFNIQRAIELNLIENQIPNPNDIQRGTKFHNDPQNTHDSQVIGTIRHSVNKLKQSTQLNKGVAESVREIRNYINSKPKNSKTQDAIKSLDKILSTTHKLSHSDTTETEALNLVWNRINSDIHKDNRDGLKDNLVTQLSEMQIHGHNVCSTGRFDRIIDTLNMVDPEVSIKPTYAINAEMMQKSAQIRNQLLDKQDNKTELERGTAANQHQFDQELKTTIINQLTKDYVDTSIMTPTKFKIELDKWINHI